LLTVCPALRRTATASRACGRRQRQRPALTRPAQTPPWPQTSAPTAAPSSCTWCVDPNTRCWAHAVQCSDTLCGCVVKAFQNTHSPMQVPEEYLNASVPTHGSKQAYFGMTRFIDEGVKNITEALKAEGLWDNTLLVYSCDNGGEQSNGGNNYPLRGEDNACVQTSLSDSWSVRVVAVIALVPLIPSGSRGCLRLPAGAGYCVPVDLHTRDGAPGGKYTNFDGGVRVGAFSTGGLVEPSARGSSSAELVHVRHAEHACSSAHHSIRHSTHHSMARAVSTSQLPYFQLWVCELCLRPPPLPTAPTAAQLPPTPSRQRPSQPARRPPPPAPRGPVAGR
jgi:hypothetical protein